MAVPQFNIHSFRNYASLFICIHALQLIDAPETIFVYLCNSWHAMVFLCSLVSVVRVDVGSSLSEVFSRGILKVVWIGCSRITAGDWYLEPSENPPSFGTGLAVVWFSCFWVGSDGKSSGVISIVGWGTSCVGVVSLVVGVSIVDLCSSVGDLGI